MKLKVCGLTQMEQIQELMALGVDYLGFIFYPKSPRYVLNHLSLEKIAEIPFSQKVGVFVNEDLAQLLKIVNTANLNLVQLHGDEDEMYLQNLREKLNPEVKIIKVCRVGENLNLPKNHQNIDFLLFDTDSKAYGGTGKTFDWQLLNQVKTDQKYFLSGGVSLNNLAQAKNLNPKPFALDINSKFEISAGVKDLELIAQMKELMKV
ncbi:phosphoribosylanthranilate isomerase [Ornithobacterium rhinotracheale]|uniref:N-(5'-phosphoribosyl)anthranilate isomerase n=1 Tax=Ornithobacterium rhinotracheale (strain ATCC 51463 / DSM 15997 / CCUG 23171 / CIP 104009 / LMG 9086) TaxID=867902 RepID=I4A142_ORNRL|nr:phosphoribosylanthranilate isomerase [Ornithobacterium rhinotracheale]AFL97676.1 phosphoribosylanthranilate isomerase [Ornithobacterium rhinotracheale DSM 15997]AIP98819.1 phosphoribosylanthranilate isomerase [Ornithobacterium rhinotracheale ORT-UMN 88]KGB66790.1 phosphoribosylanthranilate isomerase [Ornithobacterium rhinotracheale H06-030791]MBN3663185.1 phosphoribosylanthranilate isomerase [Ornithobacterium rhinotracheale]MCK0195271.1 phosphoribosylanthranilate isomerase [Ornithobacterium